MTLRDGRRSATGRCCSRSRWLRRPCCLVAAGCNLTLWGRKKVVGMIEVQAPARSEGACCRLRICLGSRGRRRPIKGRRLEGGRGGSWASSSENCLVGPLLRTAYMGPGACR